MSKIFQNDEVFMKRALLLAKKGFGKVAPNPMVGAVLVKDGKIISEGWHGYYGGPHAEVNVLKNLKNDRIRGATLYVTLEPCCHQGKTPPCTNFLISKSIKRLVVAMRDPNPLVSGKGINMLKAHGVNVTVGVLGKEAEYLNRVFVKNKTQEFPFVSIKLAMTLDGKIAPDSGKGVLISNDLSRKRVHILRSHVDAVLTTSQTVLRDNPHLGVRMVKGRDPVRVVIDSRLRTPLNSKVYRDSNVLVATTTRSSLSRRKKFEEQGIRMLVYETSKVPLKLLLKDLYRSGIYHVMTEAGSTFVASLLRERLADELILFIAPKIFGAGIPCFHDFLQHGAGGHLRIDHVHFKALGTDMMISGSILS